MSPILLLHLKTVNFCVQWAYSGPGENKLSVASFLLLQKGSAMQYYVLFLKLVGQRDRT